MSAMSDAVTALEPLLRERTAVDIGVKGVTLVHFPTEYLVDSGLPADGRWSVTWTATDHRLSRAPFRTFHAAAHYAYRVQALPGALDEIAAVCAGSSSWSPKLTQALRHAEAHAHECDAAYPAGTVIPSENSPGIVDDDGMTRQFLAQAPFVEWETDGDGNRRCKECGDASAHIWPRS